MPDVALVLVFNSEGQLLLGKRKDSGKYTVVGGHLNEGETPEECARRETLEESGLSLMSLSFLKAQKNSEGIMLHIYTGYASGNPITHNKLDPDDEVADDDWRWVDIQGGLDSKYYNNLHGPDSAEDGGHKEVKLSKAEDEIGRLLEHNDPNERLMSLRLNSVTPAHLQQAALDPDPNIWRAAVDHPLFDDMDLMNSPANPLQQQSYLLSKPDRAKSHYLDAMWRTSTGMSFDQRSQILDVIANHPLAEVNLIRTLYLSPSTNAMQRTMQLAGGRRRDRHAAASPPSGTDCRRSRRRGTQSARPRPPGRWSCGSASPSSCRSAPRSPCPTCGSRS